MILDVVFGFGGDIHFECRGVAWDPIEASGDSDHPRKLVDEPQRFRLVFHSTPPTDGIQQCLLVGLMRKQVDRFEERSLPRVVDSGDDIYSTGVLEDETADATIVFDLDGGELRLRDFIEGLPWQPVTGGGWPPLAGKSDSLKLAYELLDSIEMGGLQLPSTHDELLKALVAPPERAVDFTLDQ